MYQQNEWIKIRKEFYRHTRAQVDRSLGRDSVDLLKYRKAYERGLEKKWLPAKPKDLIKKVLESRVVFMGDFHALQQSQKAQLRLLRKVVAGNYSSRPLILGLECIDSCFQSDVDLFLQSKISERDFLSNVEWEQRWGFPWEDYKPLFFFARKHNISIRAINKTYSIRTSANLEKRDIWAADLIRDVVAESDLSLVIVFFGDMHISNGHIPKKLCRGLDASLKGKVFSIFQNPENLYFKVLKSGTDIDLVRLEDGNFCLLSVPPWVKWQNYQMYLENSLDQVLRKSSFGENNEDSDDEDDFESLDYTDHVSKHVEFISKEFDLIVSTAELSVYTVNDDHFWDRIENEFSVAQQKWIRLLAEEGLSFYLPEIESAYLAKPSVNHSATLAMQYILSQQHKTLTTFMRFPQNFESLIWLLAVSYFGVKIINHQLKSDTLIDIKNSLQKNNSDLSKEVLQLTLAQKMKELMYLTGRGQFKRTPTVRKKISYFFAAELIAGMLGEKFYNGWGRGILTSSDVRELILKDITSKKFSDEYYNSLLLVEAVPVSFKSKLEKL